jgi:hypothetical protein
MTAVLKTINGKYDGEGWFSQQSTFVNYISLFSSVLLACSARPAFIIKRILFFENERKKESDEDRGSIRMWSEKYTTSHK